MDLWAPLETEDPEIWQVVRDEEERTRSNLELIASENYPSLAVLEAMGTVLTGKYAEGYPGRRYYGGCEVVDRGEGLARERAKQLFGAEHANVQPHARARRHGHGPLTRPGGPPHPRIAGELLGAVLPLRGLSRRSRHASHRHGRG